jgi:hypothetical protein
LNACVDGTGWPCFWTTSGLCSACSPVGMADTPMNRVRQEAMSAVAERMDERFTTVLYGPDGEPLVRTDEPTAAELAELRDAFERRHTVGHFQRLYLNTPGG